MLYAQIKSGRKLHLVYEAGEGIDEQHLVKKGEVSLPLCGQKVDGNYRMVINVSLAHACKRCLKVYSQRYK